MNTFHNPQNLKVDAILSGLPPVTARNECRLLTVEEAAFLTDSNNAPLHIFTVLLKKLKPEFYSQACCRWLPVDIKSAMGALSQGLTYRTLAPIVLPNDASKTIDRFTADEFERACADFVESFNYLAAIHHELMMQKGFWDSENKILEFIGDRPELRQMVITAFDGQKLALQTTEVSETVEALRHGNGPDDKIPEFSGAEAEQADVVLRMFDQAHRRGWNVAAAIVAKLKMNATREKMHGGKQF